MAESLYFYDLETSGIDPRNDRIMQFAGQRTDLDLKPIADPDNILVKMSQDILPSPEAIMVTKITPQQTLTDGISEPEFAQYFYENIALADTTIVGFNTVRFDNEFIRFLMYRNFYDPYEWSYKNNLKVWDILDLVRITRALRPDGINWPDGPDGKPSNRLELLTKVNRISHEDAHDALSDVRATIAVAGLIKASQPKLFNYMFDIKDKQKVEELVNSGQPFVYTSGRYNSDWQKTTVVAKIADHPIYTGRALVYDLRIDPSDFMSMSEKELQTVFGLNDDIPSKDRPYFPVKELTYNKCPAVAPLAVLDKNSQHSINIDINEIQNNFQILKTDPTFAERLRTIFEVKAQKYSKKARIDLLNVETLLYEGFINDSDKRKSSQVRQAKADQLADYSPDFSDERLDRLLLLYKARNYPQILSEAEQQEWDKFLKQKLLDPKKGITKYLESLKSMQANADKDKTELLQELWLWAESIAPID